MAVALALLVTQHGDILAPVLEAHLRGMGCQHWESPHSLPCCPTAHLPGATGGARQHHGHIGHILVPGQGGPLAGPFWSVPTGAAALALQHPTAGVPAGTEGSGQGARQGGHGEGWGHHSLLGAGDIGAVGELPAVPTLISSCVQGSHAGAGDRTGICSGGRDPQHPYLALSTPPTPAPLYLALAAAGTAPRRWHRRRCSSAPARRRRAARPAGTCQGGSAARPHHRTRAGRTRPAAPDTRVQHGAAAVR